MTRSPNILITLADDQRHDLLGCLDHPDLETPNLDALARRGTCFTHAFHMGSTIPAVCAPSRAMFHTGRGLYDIPDPIRNPNHTLHERQPPDPVLFGQRLQQAGYHTHAIGKWHNGRPSVTAAFDSGDKLFFGGMSDQFRVPLNRFDPTGQYPGDARFYEDRHATEIFAGAAIDFLNRYDDDKPFFLYVAFTAPHDPRETLPQWHDRYRPDAVTLPPNLLPEHPFDNGELHIRDELLAEFPRTDAEVRRHIADYYAMTAHMDDAIGRIHAALADAGHTDNTLVIHSADHGLSVGQHGLFGKQNLYDHSTRVPLLLAGPDVPADQRDHRLVYQHDLHPTLLRCAGVEPDPECAFVDLFAESARNSVFSAYRDVQRMVRTETHKLIEYRVEGQATTQLFDLEADPWETADRADDDPDRVARLRSQLAGWQACLNDPAASLFS